MPLVDSVADRLLSWKSNLMNKVGRTTLTKVTPCAIPIHISIAVVVLPWILQAVDKIRRSFIWTSTESASGGRCTVAWDRVTRPTALGRLGVLDLTTMGYVLRLGWEWLVRTDPSRTWTAIPSKTELAVCAMFDISTTVEVGNRARTLLWKDKWLQGSSIEGMFPALVAAMNKRVA
jgi:hypothetical protein